MLICQVVMGGGGGWYGFTCKMFVVCLCLFILIGEKGSKGGLEQQEDRLGRGQCY